MAFNNKENFGPKFDNTVEQTKQSPESIKESSFLERCDLAQDSLKTGVKIENKDAFDNIKSFL